MASDSLRKKWGTIFMGGREATLDELDAMQEPVLRERQQRDQQEEYLERVRKRAADRAREILGNAYNERQKLLQDAKEELEQKRAKLLQEIEGLKAKALQMHEEAEAELEKAKQLRIEAEKVKEAAHDEGFQVGMDQAGVELKEFRADLGHELGRLMLAMEGQLEQIATFWRDDLAELMRVAVRSGLGYVLSKEYEHILENLVFQAINLLEERSVVSFRVNPEDESLVSDM
ncbi:MAG: flagellar assembly protein FliH, partial [Desulfovibrio sp.]|nr:flagellar assembly protein FliH [Desulfovibrio sp.]